MPGPPPSSGDRRRDSHQPRSFSSSTKPSNLSRPLWSSSYPANDDDDDDHETEGQHRSTTHLGSARAPVTPLASTWNQDISSKSTASRRSLQKKDEKKSDPAERARQEWRQYGYGVTQAWEDQREGRSPRGGVDTPDPSTDHLTVRVLTHQERTDPAGALYTAYVLRMVTPRGELLIERRYSDFDRLQQALRPYQYLLQPRYSSGVEDPGQAAATAAAVTFPKKHWAGRLGSWMPARTWAPETFQELVHTRTVQLDAWLVQVVHLYKQGAWPPEAATAVHQFLTLDHDTTPPCDRPNPVEGSADVHWKWNNPWSFTLGSSLRQAVHTIQHMCYQQVLHHADQSIPLDLLQAAQGLCFFTVAKAGMVVTARAGTGFVIARLDRPSSSPQSDWSSPSTPTSIPARWSAPCALGTVGLGWGLQLGGDVTHYLVVLTTRQALHDLVSSSSSVQLGAELGVAVGPVGRSANSHLQTGDWTLHSAYAYAHSQGFFVGLSLEGSVVQVRPDVNAKFYGDANCDPLELLQRPGPQAAEPLYKALNQALQEELPDHAFRLSPWWTPVSPSASSGRPRPISTVSAADLIPPRPEVLAYQQGQGQQRS